VQFISAGCMDMVINEIPETCALNTTSHVVHQAGVAWSYHMYRMCIIVNTKAHDINNV